MRRLLLFEICVGQELVLPMDHKQTFSAEKFPIEDQNGPSILAVCCSGANTASLQVVLFGRILKFFCSDLECILGHQFHWKRELQKLEMPLSRKYLPLESQQKFCCPTCKRHKCITSKFIFDG